MKKDIKILLAVIGIIVFVLRITMMQNANDRNKGVTSQRNSSPAGSSLRYTKSDIKESLSLKINTPEEFDYYSFKDSQNNYYGAKVNGTTDDTVNLILYDNLKAYDEESVRSIILPFLLGGSNVKEITFSKSDLINSINDEDEEQNFREVLISINGNEKKLQLSKIYRRNPKDLRITLDKEHKIRKDIENVLTSFYKDHSIEKQLNILNSNSFEYLKNVYDVASNKSSEDIIKYLETSDNPSTEYNILISTKYWYLNSNSSKKKFSEKDYLLFLNLLKVGLPSIERKPEYGPGVKSVDLIAKNKAIVRMGLDPVIIESSRLFTKIDFELLFTKEDGKWIIDLPSSLEFTENQIIKVMPTQHESHAKYREIVRNQIKQMNSKVVIDSIFVY